MANKFWNFVENNDDSADLQIFGDISSEEGWFDEDCTTYRNFIDELNKIGKKKCLNVLIQSGGGDVFAANAIYRALADYKNKYGAKIVGTILGLCASAATIPLMACEERRIPKNGILMAHNPSIGLCGNYKSEDLVKLAETVDKVKESIMQAYMTVLNKTEKEISDLMDEETWYIGQEAVDSGFCNVLIGDNIEDKIFDKKITAINGIGVSFKNYITNFVPEKIREKVLDSGKKEEETFFDTKNKEEKPKMKIENKEQLLTEYPDLCKEIVKDAVEKERDRLQKIDKIANGIPDDVLAKAKYAEPVTAEQLAFAQMQANAEEGEKAMDNLKDDLKQSGAGSVGATPNVTDEKEKETQKHAEKVKSFSDRLKSDKRRG